MPKPSQARPKAKSRLDNLMAPLLQKWSTDASNPCVGFGAGVIARRVSLSNAEGEPVQTVPQAIEEMQRLKVKRAEDDLPKLGRTPGFSAYTDNVLCSSSAFASCSQCRE